MSDVRWKSDPEEHDYPAAAAYLGLLAGPEEIVARKALSPVLLVRGDLMSGRALQVADGYHRVCASYHTDENTEIPCRLAAPSTRPSQLTQPGAPAAEQE
ncbi:hypothetical protein MXD59_20615 [Frankia sp. Ag45/Mut15]|uniref:ParB/Sulfiredoxin domain-containing protein n=1 Tax=Frankia umida TaxID=573489 RepID=A0ABT0K2Z8_9ACTN|nr:hypothetical protein [Frankia umida]MCK9878140.1 hypothetical protein [Frankia umida]